MIDAISVRNLALIEEAEIEPASGLTAITGETGAGKTALLTSCKLLMGHRADKNLVREGESDCLVQGRFFEDDTDSELIVSRTVSADGRSRAKINGEMISVTELAEEVEPLIGLCSQHDQRLLTKASSQRNYLDIWADTIRGGQLASYNDALEDHKAALSELELVREQTHISDAKCEDAAFKLKQIEAVNPNQQEYEELLSTFKISENAELLARVTNEAHYSLSGEEGVLDGLNAAIALLDDGATADDSLSSYSKSLRDALYVIEDVARDVSLYKDAIDLDAASFEAMQERIAAYQSLMRAYGPTVEDVIATAEDARKVLHVRDNAEEAMREAQEKVDESLRRLEDAANALTEARSKAIPDFEASVNEILSKLEMGGASLVVRMDRVSEGTWPSDGADSVTFLFKPGPSMQARPLSKIASGGELSRVMLALHVAMGDRDNTPTLLFDEIDAGVGGTAALALGDVLSQLAQTHQVIVVTHLPQVAARAERQYAAKKETTDGKPLTRIDRVDGEERTIEIARMLSGSVTEASLEHAGELLAR